MPEDTKPWLPKGADKILDTLLPLYQQNREKWPLWTYRRDSAPPGEEEFGEMFRATGEYKLEEQNTWHGCRSWAVRLQWAPAPLVHDVREQLSQYRPNTDREELRREADKEDSNRTLPIPQELQLQWAAISAQTRPEVPAKPNDTVRVSVGGRGGLDHFDTQRLGCRLVQTLTRTGRIPLFESKQSKKVVRDFGEWEQWKGTPLLVRMVWERTGRNEGRGDVREQLALELCERAGLLPNLASGSRRLLGDTRLLALYEEGLEIVEAVRDWSPAHSWLSGYIGLVDDEPRRASRREVERLRRWDDTDPLPALVDQCTPALEALLLRFPFLRRTEIQQVVLDLKTPERRLRYTTEQAARRLLLHRLPQLDPEADDSYLQNQLSQAR